jgi:hypothetical protein
MIIVFVLLFGGNKTKQLEQVESPDHMTKAILVETTPSLSIDSRGFDVYVSRIGVREHERKPIMEGGGFEDLKLTWLAPRVLQISYSRGCIGLFRNTWLAMEKNGYPYLQDGHPYSVEVRLKAPSDLTPHTCD